jgi:phosphoglycolate phosphatase
MLTHVLWDWNGTLLDDLDHVIDVMNGLLAAKRLPLLDRPSYRSAFGFPVRDYYERLGLGPEHGDFEEWARTFIDEYDRRVHDIPVRPQARGILARLRASGLRQVVLSAARTAQLRELVALHRLDEFFEELLGLDDHYAHGKLEIARAWLDRSGLDPARLLLVGDTLHDYEVACDLGIHCVLIADGHHGETRLGDCDCTVIAGLEQLYTADTPVRAFLTSPSRPGPGDPPREAIMDKKLNQELKDHMADLKRAFEEVKLKLHLAGMDVREAWKNVEPRLDELESRLVDAGRDAAHEVGSSLDRLGAALKRLGSEIEKRAKGG